MTPNKRRPLGGTKQHRMNKGWVYGIQDLADLFRVSNNSMRGMIHNRYFDPADLDSICRYWFRRRAMSLAGESNPIPTKLVGAEPPKGALAEWDGERWRIVEK